MTIFIDSEGEVTLCEVADADYQYDSDNLAQ